MRQQIYLHKEITHSKHRGASMGRQSRRSVVTVLLVVAAVWILGPHSAAGRHIKDRALLQGKAYSSWKGQDPGGNTDSFSPMGAAEASTFSKASGMYFNAGKVVRASDLLPAPFAYGYAATTSSAASLTNGENQQSYGVHSIAMTYEGARAVAGSGTAYTLGNGVTAASHNRMSYAPGNSIGDRSKSVAFTDKPGVSVAMTGSGNGPAALATSAGSTAAAFARSEHDKERDKPVVTVGSREPGKNKNTAFDKLEGFAKRMLRH